jgi:riboflavin synthase
MIYFAGMFTGIIETMGIVRQVIPNGSNRTFWIESPLSHEFKVDQSISHSGICLTIEELMGNQHRVTAIDETLQKTSLCNWQAGSLINLERSLHLNGMIDGHLVQGHVDATGICLSKKQKDGSWEFEFSYAKKFAPLVIEKGSICVNGISLTAFDVKKKSFRVAIIPYTYEHTNIGEVRTGDPVNLEFDMMGKYVYRYLSLQ